jgi:translation initiation factor 2A
MESVSAVLLRSREVAQLQALQLKRSLEEDLAQVGINEVAHVATATLPSVPPALASSTIIRFLPKDGNLLLFVHPESRACTIFRLDQTGSAMEEVACLGGLAIDEHIQDACFSPQGTYVVTWSRPHERLVEGNLRVWCCSTGAPVRAFPHRQYRANAFPYVEWTANEAFAFHAVANALDIYDGRRLSEPRLLRIPIPALGQFAVAPAALAETIGEPNIAYVATFVPETANGAPAHIQVWVVGPSAAICARHSLTDREQVASTAELSAAVVASRHVFRAQHVEFYWSPKVYGAGNYPSLVVRTSHDYDVTGRSYYGESSAYFLQPGKQHMATADALMSDGPSMPSGPIHDVGWSPTGREFVIVHGTTPARATLFHAGGTATFDFGTGPRNRVCWSPHGRFLALAGFGSMSGNVQIWDRNKKKMIGQFQAECTTQWQWSPCSRYFLVAVCYPRMKVDNGFRIFKYDGSLLYQRKYPETHLYQAEWRPAAEGIFPDRPVSPDVLANLRRASEQKRLPTDQCRQEHRSGSSQLSGNQVRPPGAYVPPHLRRQVAENGFAMPLLKLHEHEAPQSLAPIPSLTKSQRKNRKKKERVARRQQDVPSS